MRKIAILIVFILFLIKKELIMSSCITSLNIWCQSIFPILFPTFMITDLLMSTSIINDISKYLGKLWNNIFKTSYYGLYIFIISVISGTPTNAKNIKHLLNQQKITANQATKMLSMSIFFNPILIIKLCGIKVLIINYLSNILTGIILRNEIYDIPLPVEKTKINNYNLTDSLSKNVDMLLIILGTITFYNTLSTLFLTNNIFINTTISGILEITNGLLKTSYISKYKECLDLLFLSFGSLSILTQTKSILSDTKLNYKYFIKSRIISALEAIFMCILTLS